MSFVMPIKDENISIQVIQCAFNCLNLVEVKETSGSVTSFAAQLNLKA